MSSLHRQIDSLPCFESCLLLLLTTYPGMYTMIQYACAGSLAVPRLDWDGYTTMGAIDPTHPHPPPPSNRLSFHSLETLKHAPSERQRGAPFDATLTEFGNSSSAPCSWATSQSFSVSAHPARRRKPSSLRMCWSSLSLSPSLPTSASHLPRGRPRWSLGGPLVQRFLFLLCTRQYKKKLIHLNLVVLLVITHIPTRSNSKSNSNCCASRRSPALLVLLPLPITQLINFVSGVNPQGKIAERGSGLIGDSRLR